jgi:hypothetical protein
MNDKREFARHALATIAYRANRALEDAPEHFADFSSGGRAPIVILAHMGDLFDWSLSMVKGQPRWHNSAPLTWPNEVQRFFAAIQAFDAYLASSEPLHANIEPLFQGPIADALTHIGQLAMLRRMAGSPTCGENFYVAAIEIGQTGAVQPAPVKPF